MKILIGLLIALSVTQASASECMPQTPEKIAEIAKIAFVGTVTAIEDSPYAPRKSCWKRSEANPACGGKLVTLQVSDPIRGRVFSSATVVSEDACYCLGQYWTVGQPYLVVAERNLTQMPGQFIASSGCDGTSNMNEDAIKIIKALKGAKQ